MRYAKVSAICFSTVCLSVSACGVPRPKKPMERAPEVREIASKYVFSTDQSVRFEKIDSLSVEEIWCLKVNKPLYSNSTTFMIWTPHSECNPSDGDFKLVAIAIAGVGDLYEVPVGVKVWSKMELVYLHDESVGSSRGVESGTVVFGSRELSVDASPIVRNKVVAHLTIDPNGHVKANDVLIGTVE
jgi:hypothetical protein